VFCQKRKHQKHTENLRMHTTTKSKRGLYRFIKYTTFIRVHFDFQMNFISRSRVRRQSKIWRRIRRHELNWGTKSYHKTATRHYEVLDSREASSKRRPENRTINVLRGEKKGSMENPIVKSERNIRGSVLIIEECLLLSLRQPWLSMLIVRSRWREVLDSS
jgi:hypothetical protein